MKNSKTTAIFFIFIWALLLSPVRSSVMNFSELMAKQDCCETLDTNSKSCNDKSDTSPLNHCHSKCCVTTALTIFIQSEFIEDLEQPEFQYQSNEFSYLLKNTTSINKDIWQPPKIS